MGSTIGNTSAEESKMGIFLSKPAAIWRKIVTVREDGKAQRKAHIIKKAKRFRETVLKQSVL